MLEKLQEYYSQTVLFSIGETGVTFSHLVVALILVIASALISKVVCGVLQQRVFRRLKVDPGLEYALLRFLHFGIIAMGVYIGLTTISIQLNGLVAVFAVVGVGIGFGLQNVAANFISGIIILLERPVKVGDRIEIDGLWGDVERINLRTTVVNTPDNISIIVPNSKLLENNVTNYYYGDRRMRIHVEVGVAYGSDVRK
jgi:small-conductance mechanosensitive channel